MSHRPVFEHLLKSFLFLFPRTFTRWASSNLKLDLFMVVLRTDRPERAVEGAHVHALKHTCARPRGPAVLLVDVRMISYSARGRGVAVRSLPAAPLRAGETQAAAKRCTMLKSVFSPHRLARNDSYLPPPIVLKSTTQTPAAIRQSRRTSEALFHKSLWFSDVVFEPSPLEKQSLEACPRR